MNLINYFADEHIIRQLCKQRVKTAKALNARQDTLRFTGNEQVGTSTAPINSLLPSRRRWSEFRPKHRARVPDVNLASLRCAALVLRESEPELPWVAHLNSFIERIRRRVFSEQPFTFGRPSIRWEVKEDNNYRPLCRFSLENNVINSSTAKYLRDFCDHAFEPSSYAFRARSEKGVMPTHHAAFEEIYALKAAGPDQDFYVAECDIRGFYDTVDHRVALEALQRILEQVRIVSPDRQLDPRAMAIFRAYLDCYSFPYNVLELALPSWRARHPKAEAPWPAESLTKYHTNPHSRRIGVPQGGALSCIIANLVLDRADKAVRAVGERLGVEIHYFRYCDDMIVLARQESHCREAFEAYLRALEALKLPYHDPVKVEVYNKSFWKTKSKHPYCWTGRKGPGCVPWVQFVGYQIRYDGLVRIKGKSVKKQLRKIRNTADHIKFGIEKALKRNGSDRILATADQVLQSLRWKLVYSAVGNVNLKKRLQGPRRMCWAGGYKALNNKPIVPSFLKRLDWFREKQIRRMDQADIPYGSGAPSHHSGKGNRPFPIGYPFSYLAQFHNVGGHYLINHPFRPWFQRFISHPMYLFHSGGFKSAYCILRLIGKTPRLARVYRQLAQKARP